MTSAISCHLWSSVYECQRVECAFTSPVRTWIYHVWSSKECVCCACDPNERLSAPSMCFDCVFECHLGV